MPTMAARKKAAGHVGRPRWDTQNVKVERVDQVTIYERGKSCSLDYREAGIQIASKSMGIWL